jgi:hypothetical protein
MAWKFDKVMLSNAYLINSASKCISSFIIMNVSLFVYIYWLLAYFWISIDIVHGAKRSLAYNFDIK